jgi:serine/threonine protein kinase
MNGTEVDMALDRLRRARTPADLFGGDEAEAVRTYRRLARLLHPDATGGRTGGEFARLTELWRAHTRTGPITITTRRHSYRLGRKRAAGDLADLFSATFDGTRDVVIKMPRDPADGDLLEREAVALRQLPKDGDGRYLPYVPRLVESFRHRSRDGGAGTERRTNAIAALNGFYSLAEVHDAYPGGLDPRDAAWMWRRLLVGLGFAHRAGVLHGAVLPEHVLIHPEKHGVVLVDWCYSVPGCYAATDPSGRVPALVQRYAERGWYPPEVPGREQASPATDIFMATHCMTHLMGDKAPTPMRSFAKGCLLTSQRRRPGDAWRLLAEFDELLERLYGPRRFRPFTMPTPR